MKRTLWICTISIFLSVLILFVFVQAQDSSIDNLNESDLCQNLKTYSKKIIKKNDTSKTDLNEISSNLVNQIKNSPNSCKQEKYALMGELKDYYSSALEEMKYFNVAGVKVAIVIQRQILDSTSKSSQNSIDGLNGSESSVFSMMGSLQELSRERKRLDGFLDLPMIFLRSDFSKSIDEKIVALSMIHDQFVINEASDKFNQETLTFTIRALEEVSKNEQNKKVKSKIRKLINDIKSIKL